jgi:hypothetical protein
MVPLQRAGRGIGVQENQQKLALLNKILGQISLVIASGFKDYAKRVTSFNAALSPTTPMR